MLPFVLGDGRYIAGDVDGDGDLDLVAGASRRPYRLLLGDGRGAFTTASLSQLLAPASGWPQSADLADIDGDGDLDLLVGNDFVQLGRVHANDGAGVFTDITATAVPPTIGFVQNQVIGDFDGDGNVDWLTVEDSGCRFYRNNGSGVFADASAMALSGVPVVYGIPWELTARAADIDSDGDLDAMIPTGLGAQLLLVNQGGVLRPHATQPPGQLSECQFADADGDGDLDLFSRGNGRLLQNQGNGAFVEVTATAFGTTPLAVQAVFDTDDDGDVDVLSWSALWVNNGLGAFSRVANQAPYYGVGISGAAADFDGDGDLDLPGAPNFLRQIATAAAPVRGSTFASTVNGRPGVGSPFVLAGALGAGVLPVAGLGWLRLDPAALVTLGSGVASTPATTLSWSVPANPALAGISVHQQALLVDPISGPRLGNAIVDVVQ